MAPVAPKRLMVWDDLLSRPKPTADMTVRYGADALQVVDVWKPVGAGPHPAVVMIHGGCWQTEIAERDERDSSRSDSPLMKTSDSVTIDTSDISVDEVVDQIEQLLVNKRANQQASQ